MVAEDHWRLAMLLWNCHSDHEIFRTLMFSCTEASRGKSSCLARHILLFVNVCVLAVASKLLNTEKTRQLHKCTRHKKAYIEETGRMLADHFHEHSMEIHESAKPVSSPFQHPGSPWQRRHLWHCSQILLQ